VPQLVAAVLDRPALDTETLAALVSARDRLALFGGLRRSAPQPYLPPDEARDLLADYRRQGKQSGYDPRELLMPLRRALTGRDHGPELHFVLAALPADETLERLAAATGDATPPATPPPATPADTPPATPPPDTTEGDRR
jgi:hypothetical protein